MQRSQNSSTNSVSRLPSNFSYRPMIVLKTFATRSVTVMLAISTRFSANSVGNRLKPIAYKSWQNMQKMSKRLRRFVSAFLFFILRSLYLDWNEHGPRIVSKRCILLESNDSASNTLFWLYPLRTLYLDFPNQQLSFNGDFCELAPVDFFLVNMK